jgi:DNA polymerase-1
MPKTKLLIDGDIILYQSISGSEKELEFEDGVFILTTDLADAKEAFQHKIDNLLEKANVKEYVLALSGDSNFRKDFYPDYKAQRRSMRKPLGFKDFKLWVHKEYTPVVKPNIEADDVMGILATKPGADYIIWSIDKDLMQIPGKHLIDDEIVNVSAYDGDYWHLTQTLLGDTTDNYPGCPGIGKAKAEQFLPRYDKDNMPYTLGEWWSRVVALFVKAGLTKDDALIQARLARILQYPNWESNKQLPILWSPNV